VAGCVDELVCEIGYIWLSGYVGDWVVSLALVLFVSHCVCYNGFTTT